MRLDKYEPDHTIRERGKWVEVLWILAQAIVVSSFLPMSRAKVFILRAFGAEIGQGVVVKSGVRIKFPWKLKVGDHTWIGEDVWIDNLAEVTIGAHCCLSQGAYICTGSHDWSSERFDLLLKEVVLDDDVWLAASTVVAPGVVARKGAVLALGSVAVGELNAWTIYAGNPAKPIRKREIRNS